MTDKQRKITIKQPLGNAEQLECSEESGFDVALALTVAYEGSGFSGFAKQDGAITVQGCLESALETIYHHPVSTTGAGRTDAGVHALGQVVSFNLEKPELTARTLEKLRSSLNALTPEQLVVRRIEQRLPGFSARFNATQREYRYRLYFSPTPPVFMAPYAWWIPIDRPLDIKLLKAAGKLLEGEHDFKSFCVAKSAEGQVTMRNISKVHVFGAQHLGEQCVMIQIFGNAFLHSMVRVIIGTLVEVVLGKHPVEWVGEVLEVKDRRAAGQTAPAHGLTLWNVSY
jgi:tRNA pseudouridine38-40 synthase